MQGSVNLRLWNKAGLLVPIQSYRNGPAHHKRPWVSKQKALQSHKDDGHFQKSPHHKDWNWPPNLCCRKNLFSHGCNRKGCNWVALSKPSYQNLFQRTLVRQPQTRVIDIINFVWICLSVALMEQTFTVVLKIIRTLVHFCDEMSAFCQVC